jgi:Protein of unknown function (DUF3616)
VAHWNDKVAEAFRAAKNAASRISRRKKIKTTPFDEENGKVPFNASGVVQVGPQRFLFVDNHESSALFELVLDDDAEAERIARRPLAGVTRGQLRDPEGIARVDRNGEIVLVVASSLCVKGSDRSDGLVRVRYTPHGDLRAEPMVGFRAWLLGHVPSLAMAGERESDEGGLNIEGLVWDPRDGVLLFGLRGPAAPGEIAVIQVPVDAAAATWTTSSLGAPSMVRIRTTPKSTDRQGIRDICYDDQTGGFLLLLGRSTSSSDAPFQLCTWDGSSEEVTLLDVAFHRSMKPEGVTTFWSGDEKKILIVDDGGGYAVFDYPGMDQ